jgi:hypothetical protein
MDIEFHDFWRFTNAIMSHDCYICVGSLMQFLEVYIARERYVNFWSFRTVLARHLANMYGGFCLFVEVKINTEVGRKII